MKKIISLILVFVMVIALSACDQIEKLQGMELPEPPKTETAGEPSGTEPKETAQPENTPEEAVTETEPDTRVIVKVSKTEEKHYDPAEGNTLILDFAYETPFVDINGRDEAANAINEYAAMLDETYCTGNDYGDGTGYGVNMLLELATDNFTYAYETGADVSLEMSSNRTVSVERADEKVLSLQYFTFVYTGGAHGSSTSRGYVFDTKDGSLVTLDKLSDNYEELSKTILDWMKEKAANDPAYENIDNSDEALGALLRDGSWFLDGNGLVIFSDPEEIASYAQGMIRFEIPYGELGGLIDESWIPSRTAAEGELSVILQSDFEDGSMEVIDKIVTDDIGEELCLVVIGSVYDVRISGVGYADYNGEFYETEHLWNCSRIDNCAMQIKTMIPDGMPKLMISYTAGDGSRINRLLSQSGEDGSIILIDDDIVAVG